MIATANHVPGISNFPTRSLLPRQVCNHPDLITADTHDEIDYPPPAELLRQCGKLQLLDRLLTQLQRDGHKVRRCACLKPG